MQATSSFLSELDQSRPILSDGAMGTMLYAHVGRTDACFDALCDSHPEWVLDVHTRYLRAGARLIETNSFGANRFKLAAHGLADQVPGLNRAAGQLARRAVEAAGDGWVAGSVGPLGVRLAPFGRVKPVQAYDAFCQQIASLAGAGVDVLILETHSDLAEIEEAIRAARSVSDLPVIASMTFTRDDRTLLGDGPGHVARSLAEAGADVIGANCSGGPSQLLRVLAQMQQAAPGVPLSAMPNAGWPAQAGGRILYPATPGYFAEYALALSQAGVAIIGGCCGTTPEHIAAMRAALDRPSPATDVLPAVGLVPPEAADSAATPTVLESRLRQGRFVIAVEMDPPRGFSMGRLLAGASTMVEAGADVIDVADSPMAQMRMSPWAACHVIQREAGIETVLHFPTRGRSLLRVQGDLLAAHALGVRNVFAVMGDPTAVGDYPGAMDDYDLTPSGLIRLIKHGLNTGVDQSGADIGGTTSFFCGCALNPGSPDADHEIEVLHRKIDAGADFILTQPVFQPASLAACLDRYAARFGPLTVPVIAGVLPLFGSRHAAYLTNEVPGIHIPESHFARLRAAGDRAPEVGVAMATEVALELAGRSSGIYLMPSFHRYDLAADVIESIRAGSPPT